MTALGSSKIWILVPDWSRLKSLEPKAGDVTRKIGPLYFEIQVASLFEQGTLVRNCPWCLLLQMFRSTSCYKKAQLMLEQFSD